MKPLNLRETAEITGVPIATLGDWRRSRTLKTVLGDPKHFAPLSILAAAIYQNLRNRGVDAAAAKSAMVALISRRDIASVQADGEAGKIFLVGCGDRMIPWLLRRQEIFANEFLPLREAIESGLPVLVVDTQEAFQALQKFVDEKLPESVKGAEACQS